MDESFDQTKKEQAGSAVASLIFQSDLGAESIVIGSDSRITCSHRGRDIFNDAYHNKLVSVGVNNSIVVGSAGYMYYAERGIAKVRGMDDPVDVVFTLRENTPVNRCQFQVASYFEGHARLFEIDLDLSVREIRRCTAIGSGYTVAESVLKKGVCDGKWRNMKIEKAAEIVREAIYKVSHTDKYTGGTLHAMYIGPYLIDDLYEPGAECNIKRLC